MKLTRLAAGGALALGLVLFAACASVRSTALSWSNSELTGQVAPPLDSGVWVAAEQWHHAEHLAGTVEAILAKHLLRRHGTMTVELLQHVIDETLAGSHISSSSRQLGQLVNG